MTEKVQINPLITPETREALRQACKERGMAQGDLVELALQAYLEPLTITDEVQRLSERYDAIMGMLGKLEDTVLLVVDALRGVLNTPSPAPPETPEGTPQIATYAQMYGPVAASLPVQKPGTPDAAAQTSRLRRWFLREERR